MRNELFGLNITKLSVKNFATFDDQTVNFDHKFNAIIGETGSGKSLILDALQLILGHRADKKLIRKDCEYAIVESSFTCHDETIKDYFFNSGFPFDENEIIIKRVLYKTGKTKSFLNHQSCSLSVLVDFSKRYIDLVGQFENQKLLSEDYQIQLLDDFSINNSLCDEYNNIFNLIVKTQKELDSLILQSTESNKKIDYIAFQISELEQLSPEVGREAELLKKKRFLLNLEENRDSIQHLNVLFGGVDNGSGLLELMNRVEKYLTPKLIDEDSVNNFQNAKEVMNDLNYKINSTLESDFNEDEFEDVLTELDNYQKLKRKFNVDTKGLVGVYESFLLERDEISNAEGSITIYEDRILSLKSEAYELARRIHDRRVKAAKTLSAKLTGEIRNLRMIGATIDIKLDKTEDLGKNGFSSIQFLSETNPGEGYYKIKDIASGGELSRILLALRTVLSTRDSISIFLFDEIDTGIGGETAVSVGKALSTVALSSQVIAVTHLPQIANFAQKLVIVKKDIIKSNNQERTVSIINEISGEMIRKEIKQMNALQ